MTMALHPKHPKFVTNALDHDGVRSVILQIVQAEVSDVNQKLKDKEKQIWQMEQKHATEVGRLQFKLEIYEEQVKRLNEQIEQLKSQHGIVTPQKEQDSPSVQNAKRHFNAVIGDLTATNFALKAEVNTLRLAANRKWLIKTTQNVMGKTLKIQVGKTNFPTKIKKSVRQTTDKSRAVVKLQGKDKPSNTACHVVDTPPIEGPQLVEEAIHLNLLATNSDASSSSTHEESDADVDTDEDGETELDGSLLDEGDADDEDEENASPKQVDGPHKKSPKRNIQQGRNTRPVNTRKTFLCGFCINSTRTFPSLTMLGNHIKKCHKKEHSHWLIRKKVEAKKKLEKKGKIHGYSSRGLQSTSHSGTNALQFSCKCGKGYKDKSGLAKHVLKMSTGKLFSCPECEEQFYNTSEVKQHVKKQHKKSYNKIGCTKCGSVFAKLNELQIHRVSAH